jgi:hypothetical protein
MGVLAGLLASVVVQQPCSNLSKYPETLRKASTRKYSDLQVFCKLQKALEKYRAAFARRRSGVRIPSAPLRKSTYLQVKRTRHSSFLLLLLANVRSYSAVRRQHP